MNLDGLYYTLARVFQTYRTVKDVEIELRFGWKTTKMFDTNIGKRYFDVISNTLQTMLHTTKKESQDEIHIHQNKRYIVGENTEVQVKTRLETIDFQLEGTPFDIRISVCQETPKSLLEHPLPESSNWIRKRNRTSIQYKMWNYELTEVTVHKPRNDDEDTCTLYEFEIEFNTQYDQNASNSYLAHSLYLKVLDILQFEHRVDKTSEKCHLKNIVIINQTKT